MRRPTMALAEQRSLWSDGLLEVVTGAEEVRLVGRALTLEFPTFVQRKPDWGLTTEKLAR